MHDQGHDLRAFFQQMGGVEGGGGAATTEERADAVADVEQIDDDAQEVTSAPLEVAGYVDGIQASLRVRHIEHRPVTLSYVAAGAVTGKGKWLGMAEELVVLCSSQDRASIEAAAGSIPVRCIDGEVTELERLVRDHISTSRDALERAVIGQVAAAGHVPLLVDGDLKSRASEYQLVGVAKTLRTRYLADEQVLFDLPFGWRSPRFRIGDGGAYRYSCYVRLQHAERRAWDFGLVRLETYDPDLLDALAARCLHERQGSMSPDGRFDRHLAPVRMCEDMLKARKPVAFSLP